MATGVASASMIVAVTGHRPQHLRLDDGYWIQGEFDRLIEKLQPTVAISGMAIGADTWWANSALYADVPLHAYIPFPEQDASWRHDDRSFYRELLAKAARIVTVCPEYAPEAFELRNRLMVDDCELLIAAWNGKRSGGTFNALRYAERVGRDLIFVDPVRRVTTRRVSQSARSGAVQLNGPESEPSCRLTDERTTA